MCGFIKLALLLFVVLGIDLISSWMPYLQLSSGAQWGLYFNFSVVYGSQFCGVLGSSIERGHETEKDNLCLNKTITDSKHVAKKKKKKGKANAI